jgi:DNA-binding response OmpR family regulator
VIPEPEIPMVVALHDAFGVTPREARGLALLAQGGIVHVERICEVYCESPYAGPDEARHWVKRIRKRAPDLQIITHRGFGYELAAESLEAVRAVLQEVDA